MKAVQNSKLYLILDYSIQKFQNAHFALDRVWDIENTLKY